MIVLELPLRVNANARGHTRFREGVTIGGKRFTYRQTAEVLFRTRWQARKVPPKLDAGLLITLKRIAPSKLDAHDNLRTAMKPIVDGIADALGLPNDRDPRVTWAYDQGPRGVREYAVEITVEQRGGVCPTCGKAP